MDPAFVVLHYNTEKWAEQNSGEKQNSGHILNSGHKLNSASPSKFVTFNYRPENLATPSPCRAPSKRRPEAETTEFFEKPVADSLKYLAAYTALVEKEPIVAVEKNWYHDLTNVAQRLLLLRDTFKVLQSVRKKRSMGEKADFRSVHDFRTSRTGSPTVLDDERHSDDDETSSAPERPVSRRGRPRKGQTRGRKPANPRKTETPTPRARPSRRAAAVAAAAVAVSSPSDAQTSDTILHLPPILPSQRVAIPLVILQYFGAGTARPELHIPGIQNQSQSQNQSQNQGKNQIHSQSSQNPPPNFRTIPPIVGQGPVGLTPTLSESTRSIIENLKKNPQLGIPAFSHAYNTQFLPPMQQVRLPPLQWANSTPSSFQEHPVLPSQPGPSQVTRGQVTNYQGPRTHGQVMQDQTMPGQMIPGQMMPGQMIPGQMIDQRVPAPPGQVTLNLQHGVVAETHLPGLHLPQLRSPHASHSPAPSSIASQSHVPPSSPPSHLTQVSPPSHLTEKEANVRTAK